MTALLEAKDTWALGERSTQLPPNHPNGLFYHYTMEDALRFVEEHQDWVYKVVNLRGKDRPGTTPCILNNLIAHPISPDDPDKWGITAVCEYLYPVKEKVLDERRDEMVNTDNWVQAPFLGNFWITLRLENGKPVHGRDMKARMSNEPLGY